MARLSEPTIGLPYDPASQVTNILHQLTATSTQINQAAYAYNGVGNRTSLTDRRGAQAFSYDALDRLTSASHPLLGTAQSFAYDPVGNRTTGGSVVNSGNQLTADSNFGYQYDDNGNLTRKTLLATGNFTAYTYDAENRLTKVEEFAAGNPTPAATSTYRYDGLGRRIEKIANGQTKRYIYDGEDILLEYDGANVLQTRYTHGPGIDEPITVTKGGATYFYRQDGLGTVTDLTDSAGMTAKSYAYDAYGNTLESPGTLEQPYTYTGREFDAESGLLYYRARYYDPVIGRFLSKDPFGLENGPNAYMYGFNSPVSFFDPLGLTTWPACGPISSGFGRRVDPKTGKSGKEHKGVDIAVPYGTDIVASDTGTVTRAGKASSGENRVEVKHPDGSTSVYRHVNPSVQKGAVVQEGGSIGTTDSSGFQTGPHLHYEYIDPQNKPIDPANHLPPTCGPC